MRHGWTRSVETCRLVVVLAALSWGAARASAAERLPPSAASYRIAVWIDPPRRGIRGHVSLRFRNPSAETLRRAPLHLYLNAFSHEGTTWARGVPWARFGVEDLLARFPDPWGYTELVKLEQVLPDGSRRRARAAPIQPDDGNPLDRSLVEVALPRAVAPGETLALELDFAGRLPVPVARTGGADDYFFVAQWFPKLGAFEQAGVRHRARAGWAARQYHGPTEYYANFADYEVTVHAPAGYEVQAPGERAELAAAGGARRVRFRRRAVHDFAFVVARGLAARQAAVRLPGGATVAVRYLMPERAAHQLPRWRRAVEGAFAVYARRIGRYPYGELTAVLPPWCARRTGGMEYPTLITGVPGDPLWDSPLFAGLRDVDGVLIHELGHQFFYGVVATDEQEDAFLDEGFTTYWQLEAMRELYGASTSGGRVLGRPIDAYEIVAWQLAAAEPVIRESIRKRPAALFYPGSWSAQIYTRTAMTLATAAARFGQRTIDAIFAAYFARWAFRHPDPEDFLAVAQEVGGAEVAAMLREAFAQRGLADYRVAALSSAPFDAPRGRVPTPSGPLWVTSADSAARAPLVVDEAARERDGTVAVEIVDPGWVGARGAQRGTVRRVAWRPAPAPRKGAGGERFYESSVRLAGPGWQQLPVEVVFEFDDGAVVRETWDGRATWRAYRFLRRGALTRVRVDPRRRVLLDVRPENNARAVAADPRFAADWGLWLTAAGQWLIGALSSWL